MYDHGRSLVEKHREDPFALIGVNSDSDREVIRAIVKEKSLPWRSFWNGPEATRGPISTRWNVTMWPTIFLIDHEGVLRHRDLRGTHLDAAIQSLIDEARSATK